MAIDRFKLADELNALRELAARKWKEDPLPVGRAAMDRLKREIEENDLHKNIAELETDGYTILAPGTAAPLDLIDRIKTAMDRLAESKRTDTMGSAWLRFHPLSYVARRSRLRGSFNGTSAANVG